MKLPEQTMEFLASSLLELITQTSTNLPPDVRAAVSLAADTETPGTQSSQAFDIILTNIDMAVGDEGPICQDTGMPTFYVHTPVGVNQIRIKGAIIQAGPKPRGSANCAPIRSIPLPARIAATTWATKRRSSISSNGKQDEIEVKLILKGGGCENKNIQYSVPCNPRSSRPRRPQSGRRP